MTSMHSNENPHAESVQTTQGLVVGFWGVRYQVRDVQRAISFYTHTLGFNLDMQNLPAFGQVSIAGLKLILSGPGASGSRAMPDGRQQEPGGWNRVLVQVQILQRHGDRDPDQAERLQPANNFLAIHRASFARCGPSTSDPATAPSNSTISARAVAFASFTPAAIVHSRKRSVNHSR